MERHDLLHEFPEYHDNNSSTKTDDSHFRKLFDEYHELEHEVHRLIQILRVTDEHAHEVKLNY
jgi:uncharacterized protein YdcH (DUF465 family)